MKKISSLKDTTDLAVTIYNEGFGAVKEIRKVNMTGTETELVYTDVAQKIETNSLLVEGLDVLEFNYEYDLVDRVKLLRKYIDKEVFLSDRKTGERKRCRLLSAEGAGKCVLEDVESKEIYLDTQSEIVLPSLPSGLIVKPALVWKIAESKTEEIKVSYLSKGFKWNANYVVELQENVMNISGWAEIDNQSGATFENVRIKLIAGEVNRISDRNMLYDENCYMAVRETASKKKKKTFFDYHMYTMNQLTTLKDNQSKQINILGGTGIPFTQYYYLNLFYEKTDIIIEFHNSKANGLGKALPKGKVKLYKADEADNSLEFIGEDEIDHTPKDETIKLSIGKAFDITYKYNEINHRKSNGFEYFKYECVIKNHKETEVNVRFEPYIRGIWEMVKSSHEYKIIDSSTIEYTVVVPADGEVKVEYEYKIDNRVEVVIKK